MTEKELNNSIISRLEDMSVRIHKLADEGDTDTMQLLIQETNEIATYSDCPEYEWLYIPANFGTHLAYNPEENNR